MKTILPISIAVLFLFAPGFYQMQTLAPNRNVPAIPFHTPAYREGKALPRHIKETITVQPEDGIILVNTIVTIEKNASLIIKPGTTIAASEYSGIRVLGNLQAIGTKKSPIQFISNELNETNRNWNGILFEPTSEGHIEHAIVHHASPAISCSLPGKIILQENKYLFGNLDIYGPC